ncbi:MAG: hypothetical protein J6S71_06015 [Clostridia bacterium]|nr:hypothetical protein [Clostridia bacterium]
MKNFVRLIALMLVLITVTGMFAACATTNDPETTTEAPTTNAPGEGGEGQVTEEETLYVPDDLDEKYDFGETMTVLYWEEWRMTEFFAEESGDIIEDAIFHRNIKVADRLGIEFEFIAQPGDSTNHTAYVQQAENDWAADNEYDIYAGYSRTIPLLTIKKMTANLLEQDAFNVNKPWWPEALTTECTIKDQLYFCTGDISTSMLWYMIAFMYNKELYENHINNGGKTPMDMVDADEWTLQNFLALVQDLYIDTNSDGQKDVTDFYGATIYSTDIDSFMIGAGITSLEKDEEGGLRISEKWNSQRCADICETVGNAMNLQGILCNTDRSTFKTQQSVFHMDRVFNIPGTDSGDGVPLEFTVGVVPVPKFDETQVDYKTNLGNPFTIYALNAQSKSLEAAATTLEAMGSENYRSVTPAVFEVAMKVRYTDDPQVAEMFDILKENVSFDVGKLYYYTMEKTTSQVFSNTCLSGNPAGFLSALKTSTRVINNKLKTLMAAYE